MINIIKRPIVTEKAMKLQQQRQYVFDVAPGANKIEIKRTIEEIFEVNVLSIRTVRIKGKKKSRMTRHGYMRGQTALKKKAYITLKEGQTIDIVTGGTAS